MTHDETARDTVQSLVAEVTHGRLTRREALARGAAAGIALPALMSLAGAGIAAAQDGDAESGREAGRHVARGPVGRPGRARSALDPAHGRLARDRARLRGPAHGRSDIGPGVPTGRVLGDFRGRPHLHLHSSPGREVPQWPGFHRGRCGLQLRAHQEPGHRVAFCQRLREGCLHRCYRCRDSCLHAGSAGCVVPGQAHPEHGGDRTERSGRGERRPDARPWSARDHSSSWSTSRTPVSHWSATPSTGMPRCRMSTDSSSWWRPTIRAPHRARVGHGGLHRVRASSRTCRSSRATIRSRSSVTRTRISDTWQSTSTKEPFDKLEVRQAIAMVIDRATDDRRRHLRRGHPHRQHLPGHVLGRVRDGDSGPGHRGREGAAGVGWPWRRVLRKDSLLGTVLVL